MSTSDTESEHSEVETMLSAMVDNIPLGVSLISPRLEILKLNVQMKRWFPDIDEAERRLCYQAFNSPPRGEICPWCPTIRTLQDGRVHEAITETPTDRGVVNYRVVSSPVKDEAGRVIAAVEAVEDVTPETKAEEDLRFTNIVLATQQEASIDGILIIDAEGKVLSYNRRFVEIWEIPADVLATKSDQRLLESVLNKLAAPQEFLDKVNYLYEHRELTSRDEVAFADGQFLDRYSAPMRASDGKYYGRVWYFRDITESKHTAEALAQRTLQLERSNRELEQFAYVASHDLQEPLRMVSSYTQLLAKRYGDRLDQDAHEFIDFAVSGANRMQRLINDLLSYSRVGTRGKPLVMVDSGAALRQAVQNLALTIEEHGAAVTSAGLPTLHADDLQLVQLFQNLIGNAITFRRDEPPRIHVSAERAGRTWTFSVRDNGMGIAPQYHAKIFEIFQRLHGKEVSGTGIGLAICKRIVERHGGKIWVDSEPDQGATFFFSLPE